MLLPHQDSWLYKHTGSHLRCVPELNALVPYKEPNYWIQMEESSQDLGQKEWDQGPHSKHGCSIKRTFQLPNNSGRCSCQVKIAKGCFERAFPGGDDQITTKRELEACLLHLCSMCSLLFWFCGFSLPLLLGIGPAGKEVWT